MKMLMRVELPHERFNAYVMDGNVEKTMKRILEATKPEAVYFTEFHGHRGAIMVVNVEDPSKVPALAEPWFVQFDADVEFHVVMTPEELGRAGIDEMAKRWK